MKLELNDKDTSNLLVVLLFAEGLINKDFSFSKDILEFIQRMTKEIGKQRNEKYIQEQKTK